MEKTDRIELGLGVFNPKYINKKRRMQLITAFKVTGTSTHSSRMDTIGYIIKYCMVNNIPFIVKFACFPGGGLVISKMKSIKELGINSTKKYDG